MMFILLPMKAESFTCFLDSKMSISVYESSHAPGRYEGPADCITLEDKPAAIQ